jgi:hypothetical protein
MNNAKFRVPTTRHLTHHFVPINFVTGRVKFSRKGLPPGSAFVKRRVDYACPVRRNFDLSNLKCANMGTIKFADKISELYEHVLTSARLGRFAAQIPFVLKIVRRLPEGRGYVRTR